MTTEALKLVDACPRPEKTTTPRCIYLFKVIAGETAYSIGLTVVTLFVDSFLVVPCGFRSVGAHFISLEQCMVTVL